MPGKCTICDGDHRSHQCTSKEAIGPRGARFKVLDQDRAEEELLVSDWIVLDIPGHLLGQVIEQLQVCKDTYDTIDAVELKEKGLWCNHLYVEANHPKTVGPIKKDGSPPDIGWPPSLLSDDIPRE